MLISVSFLLNIESLVRPTFDLKILEKKLVPCFQYCFIVPRSASVVVVFYRKGDFISSNRAVGMLSQEAYLFGFSSKFLSHAPSFDSSISNLRIMGPELHVSLEVVFYGCNTPQLPVTRRRFFHEFPCY